MRDKVQVEKHEFQATADDFVNTRPISSAICGSALDNHKKV